MIEICFNIPILTTAASDDPGIWVFFLFIFMIGCIVALIILISHSKKPEDWQHKSVTGEYYASGRFKDLAESIKLITPDYIDNSHLKKLIITTFYEKIQSTRGLSVDDFKELNKKNKKKLEEIIQDRDIINWILNVSTKKENWLTNILKSKPSKRDQFFVDINIVLDKMEAWGE
jgi:hypothetical protein